MNHITDSDIQNLEDQFPPRSGVAFTDARNQALSSGQSVLESKDGAIYEVFPDGSRVFVKSIELPVNVTCGQKIELL